MMVRTRKHIKSTPRTRPPGRLTFDIKILEFNEVKRDTSHKERHDIYFDVTLQVNGGQLQGQVHLLSEAYRKSPVGSIWEVTSEWDTYNGIHIDSYHDCIECNGNDGRSGPLTSGETAIAFAKVVFVHLKELGFQLRLSDWNAGGWFLFSVRVNRLSSERTNRKTRFMYHVDADTIVCPIHGQHVQYVHEYDL